MQRIATWVFIGASVAFGIVGSLFFITLVDGDAWFSIDGWLLAAIAAAVYPALRAGLSSPGQLTRDDL